VSVRVARDRAEEARALMLELFPEGFEEVEADGGVELAAYTGPGGEERVWQVFGPGRVDEVEPDWGERWRAFHQPVRVGPLWIGPPWHRPDPGATAVVIDPGRAFGTGAHPTTRLCAEHLLALRPGSLVDLGCGSGVLAIAAAKLGFRPVIALDLDPAAVAAAGENALANDVEVAVAREDVLEEPLPEADVAIANIELELSERLAARVLATVVITSGYLASERPEPAGLKAVARLEADGWAADRFERRN
jgi:ribosomal protein L11 methyltransferase